MYRLNVFPLIGTNYDAVYFIKLAILYICSSIDEINVAKLRKMLHCKNDKRGDIIRHLKINNLSDMKDTSVIKYED